MPLDLKRFAALEKLVTDTQKTTMQTKERQKRKFDGQTPPTHPTMCQPCPKD